MPETMVWTFFYGSFINPDVHRRADIVPERAELARLYAYAREDLGGVYLPEAVLVETMAGRWLSALCYIAHEMEPASAADDYVDRIVGPARAYGFPDWYVDRLEGVRPSRGGHRRCPV